MRGVIHEQSDAQTHTPGPWTQNICHGGELTGVEAAIAEMEDCEAFALSQARVAEIDAAVTWDSREPGRTERALADARLLISAPDLLKALEAVLKECQVAAPGPHWRWHDEYYEAFDQARAAFTKATEDTS